MNEIKSPHEREKRGQGKKAISVVESRLGLNWTRWKSFKSYKGCESSSDETTMDTLTPHLPISSSSIANGHTKKACSSTSKRSSFLNTLPSSDDESSDDDEDVVNSSSRPTKVASANSMTATATASIANDNHNSKPTTPSPSMDISATLLKIGQFNQQAMQRSHKRARSHCMGSASAVLPSLAGWKLCSSPSKNTNRAIPLPMPLTVVPATIRSMKGVQRHARWELPASLVTASNPQWSRGIAELVEQTILPGLNLPALFGGTNNPNNTWFVRPVLQKLIVLERHSRYEQHASSNDSSSGENDVDINELIKDDDDDSNSLPFGKRRRTQSLGTLAIQLPSEYSGGRWTIAKGAHSVSTHFPNAAYEPYYMAFRPDCQFCIETVEDGVSSVLLYSLDYTGFQPLKEEVTDNQQELDWECAEMGRLIESLPQDELCFGLPMGADGHSKQLEILKRATKDFEKMEWMSSTIENGALGASWLTGFQPKLSQLTDDNLGRILVPESDQTKQSDYQGHILVLVSENTMLDCLLKHDFDCALKKVVMKSKPHLLERLEHFLQSNSPVLSKKHASQLMRLISVEEAHRGVHATDFGMAQVLRCVDRKEVLRMEQLWCDVFAFLERNAFITLLTSLNVVQALESILSFEEKLGISHFLEQTKWILRMSRDVPDAADAFANRLLEMNLVLFIDSKSLSFQCDQDKYQTIGRLIISLSEEFGWFEKIKPIAVAVFDLMKVDRSSMKLLETRWEILKDVDTKVPAAHLKTYQNDVLTDFAALIEDTINATSSLTDNSETLDLPNSLVNALMEEGNDALFFRMESCLASCTFEQLAKLDQTIGRHSKAKEGFARTEFTESVSEKLTLAKVKSLGRYGSKLLDRGSPFSTREDWASYVISLRNQDYSWDDMLPPLLKCFDRIGQNADRRLMNQRWTDLVTIQQALPDADLHDLIQRALHDFVKLIVRGGWDSQVTPNYAAIPPMAGQYDSVLRTLEETGSFFVDVGRIEAGGYCCSFLGYRGYTNGEMGPPERDSAVKNPRDIIVAIQGQSMFRKSFEEVLAIFRSQLPNKYCCIRWATPSSLIEGAKDKNPLLLALLEHGEDHHFDEIEGWIRSTPSDQLKSFWAALPENVSDLRSEARLFRLRFLQKDKAYREAAASSSSPARKKARLSSCP